MRISDWSSDVCSSDLLDMGDELGRFGGRPQGVAGDDRGPGLREAQLYLVGDAFDAGAAGDQAVLVLAFGAEPRRRHDMAALVAGDAVDEAVFHHPGG